MKLEDFVSNSIVEIISGIKDAQDRLRTKNIHAAINPIWKNLGLREQNVQDLEFDVAVTIGTSDSSNKGAGAKVGIQVVGASIGATAEHKAENSSVSRVKFSLPFIPPSTSVDADS